MEYLINNMDETFDLSCTLESKMCTIRRKIIIVLCILYNKYIYYYYYLYKVRSI